MHSDSKHLRELILIVLIFSVLPIIVISEDKQTPPDKSTILNLAEKSGFWLISQAKSKDKGDTGYYWLNPEDNFVRTGLDCGVAGVGLFLIEIYDKTHNKQYLEYAEGSARWLINQAVSVEKGYKWPHPDGDIPSGWYLSSQGTGTSGIGEFFLKMYQITHKEEYLKYAKGAAEWLMTCAVQDNGGLYIPYNPDHQAAHGISPGREAQTVLFLLHLHQAIKASKVEITIQLETRIKDLIKQLGADDWQIREAATVSLTKIGSVATSYLKEALKSSDPEVRLRSQQILSNLIEEEKYLKYVHGLAKWLINTAVPENDGYKWQNDIPYHPHFSIPVAVDVADFFYEAYQSLEDEKYLRYGNGALQWIMSQAVIKDNTAKWPERPAGNTYFLTYGTGKPSTGLALIGEAFLKGYLVNKDKKFLEYAKKQANWVIVQAIEEKEGYKFSRREDEKQFSAFTNAQVYRFLKTIYQITKDNNYLKYAEGTLKWIQNTASNDGTGYKWTATQSSNVCIPYFGDGVTGIAYILLKSEE